MGLIQTLENDIAGLFSKAKAEGETFLEAIEPIIKSDVSNLLAALIPIAMPIVQSLETTGTVSNAKRDTAVSQLTAAAESAGISAGVSVLNAAVELAVQNVKAASTALAAPAGSTATAATTPSANVAAASEASSVG